MEKVLQYEYKLNHSIEEYITSLDIIIGWKFKIILSRKQRRSQAIIFLEQ